MPAERGWASRASIFSAGSRSAFPPRWPGGFSSIAWRSAVELVQEDRGGPLRGGFGQGNPRGGGDFIGVLTADPLAPRNRPTACTFQKRGDRGDGGVSAVAMDFDRLLRAAADDNLFAGVVAESPESQFFISRESKRFISRVKEDLTADSAGTFDEERGHGAAAGGS